MQKKIKYISFYDDMGDLIENRQYALSAVNKINYISDVLVDNGYEVDIVSPSWTNNDSGYYKSRYKKLRKGINLRLFKTFGARIRLFRMFKYILSLIQLCIYLIFNTKKGEYVIVYHSVILSKPISIVKKIKKLKLVLEVEEIYSDITKNEKQRCTEYKLFKSADAFIFPTELLNDTLNKESKPYAITYGTYKVEDDRSAKFEDNKIHVVYAGTFDPTKGGAIAAIGAAEYLDENYHIHIIGFGNEDQKQMVKNKIYDVSRKSKCGISYDGLYRGEEYIKFLQKCHIGLSTQTPNGQYNNTSFPSKVLSYMANGLRVVSIRIKVLEESDINNLLYYYENDCSKDIAHAIKSVDLLEKYDSRKKIKDLDEKFIVDIKELVEKIDE